MKSHQQILVWLSGLRENGHRWHWLVVMSLSFALLVGGLGWQAQASAFQNNRFVQSSKTELFDSRTGAMLAMATNHDANANKINQLSLGFLAAGSVVGGYCWYRAKHRQR